jgi:hypothetical protein
VASVSASRPALPIAAAPAPAPAPVVVRVRMPSGTVLQHEFASTDTLLAIYEFVNRDRDGAASFGRQNFSLIQQHPRIEFEAKHTAMTLGDLHLDKATLLCVVAGHAAPQ